MRVSAHDSRPPRRIGLPIWEYNELPEPTIIQREGSIQEQAADQKYMPTVPIFRERALTQTLTSLANI